MVLITGMIPLKEGFLKEEGASMVYIEIDKKYLSKAYELPRNSKIVGEIIDIQTGKEFEGELKGKEISFILIPTFGTTDYLYLSKDSWRILRDYAILPGESLINVKLEKAVVNEKEILLYPKRDKQI